MYTTDLYTKLVTKKDIYMLNSNAEIIAVTDAPIKPSKIT